MFISVRILSHSQVDLKFYPHCDCDSYISSQSIISINAKSVGNFSVKCKVSRYDYDRGVNSRLSYAAVDHIPDFYENAIRIEDCFLH
ncbi:hypothetical protein WN51_02947 [Melipona quadrifasciata]|uniref:Uncharacterized protein n=1 Tax=Melipona quadrifasciata TaxID=166423 RepID=A0A0N0BJU9_9HYME|nr:hypothetical protein WN51_02947 [Melipona quadrifasciata]